MRALPDSADRASDSERTVVPLPSKLNRLRPSQSMALKYYGVPGAVTGASMVTVPACWKVKVSGTAG
jgi:hypothetical protein